MKTKELVNTIGTHVVIGAATAAGAALWNKVLEVKLIKAKNGIVKRLSR